MSKKSSLLIQTLSKKIHLNKSKMHNQEKTLQTSYRSKNLTENFETVNHKNKLQIPFSEHNNFEDIRNVEGWQQEQDQPIHTNLLYNLSSNINAYEKIQKRISSKNQLSKIKEEYRYILNEKAINRPITMLHKQKDRSDNVQYYSNEINSVKATKSHKIKQQIKTYESKQIKQIIKNLDRQQTIMKQINSEDLFEKRNIFKMKSNKMLNERTNTLKQIRFKVKKHKINEQIKKSFQQKKTKIKNIESKEYIKNSKNRNQLKKKIQMVLNPFRNHQKQEFEQKPKFFIRRTENYKSNQYIQKNIVNDQFQDQKLFRFR